MQGIPPCSTVFIEALEGHANGLEGQFIPGDAFFLEELGLDGFGAWVEGGGQEAGPVIKMNLAHPNDIDQREKPLQLDLGTRAITVYQAALAAGFNLRQVSVGKDIGIVCLELEGERVEIKAAVKWLEALGVRVEPVEINILEN